MAAVGIMAYPVRDGLSDPLQPYPSYQTRAHLPQGDMASALTSNPYSNHTPITLPPSTSQQSQWRSPQGTGSPTTEEGHKPSLPSISNLLVIADGDRPANANASQQARPRPVHSQPSRHPSYPTQDGMNSHRPSIAPTPPLPRNDSFAEGTQSPSTISTGSSLSTQQPYFMSSINNVEADHQRAVAHSNNLMKKPLPQSFSSQPNTSPYGSSPYTTSPYAHSPGAGSTASYYSPPDPTYQQQPSTLYHQRPLPSNFPPPPPPPQPSAATQPTQHLTPTLPLTTTTTNPWEHHHYISASSQATFPQSQDRYICPTCNKAFSRPSSLKIHSHSHTGEKPFKCPHAGCGKAFSVRSNMKRHERGCHSGLQGVGMGVPGHLV